MNTYELTVILRVGESLESNKEKVKGIIQKYGVTITSENHWGLKRLAYLIDGEKDGFYMFMELEAPADSVQKIISEFRINSDILRHLFVRPKAKKTA